MLTNQGTPHSTKSYAAPPRPVTTELAPPPHTSLPPTSLANHAVDTTNTNADATAPRRTSCVTFIPNHDNNKNNNNVYTNDNNTTTTNNNNIQTKTDAATPRRSSSVTFITTTVHHDNDDANSTGKNGGQRGSRGAGHRGSEISVRSVDTRESACELMTSCRWTLAYMGSAMTLLIMALRNCMSMAIVCIANLPPHGAEGDASWNESYGGNSSARVTSQNAYLPVDQQGLVLSSYFYGYVVTPFLGGLVAERLGAKRVLFVAMALSGLLCILTPLAIRTNVYLTVAVRGLMGLVSGVCLPSITSMWAYWAPQEEKARLLSVTYAGSSTGSIVANFASGFLCSIPYDEGWPFIFYVYGGIALLWAVIWHFVAFDIPEQHPRIQPKERVLIRRRRASDPHAKKAGAPPMKDILKSPVFLALLGTHFSYTWALGNFATYLPIYFNDVLHFDTQLNGVLSSVPFVVRVLFSVIFAVLSDRFTSGLMTTTHSRKFFQTLGLVVPGVLLVGTGLLDPEMRYAAVGLMILATAFNAACMCGFRLNPLDIAPRYAGSLSGLSISFAGMALIISPLIISPMVADKRQESWRNVFIMTAGLSVFGAILFAALGSGEEQDWAKERPPARSSTSGGVTLHNGAASGDAADHYAEIEVEMEIPEEVDGGPDSSLDKGKLNFAFCEEEEEEEKNGGVFSVRL